MAKVWLVCDDNEFWVSDVEPPTAWYRRWVEVDINASRLKYIGRIRNKFYETQKFLGKVYDDATENPGETKRYG